MPPRILCPSNGAAPSGTRRGEPGIVGLTGARAAVQDPQVTACGAPRELRRPRSRRPGGLRCRLTHRSPAAALGQELNFTCPAARRAETAAAHPPVLMRRLDPTLQSLMANLFFAGTRRRNQRRRARRGGAQPVGGVSGGAVHDAPPDGGAAHRARRTPGAHWAARTMGPVPCATQLGAHRERHPGRSGGTDLPILASVFHAAFSLREWRPCRSLPALDMSPGLVCGRAQRSTRDIHGLPRQAWPSRAVGRKPGRAPVIQGRRPPSPWWKGRVRLGRHAGHARWS